MKTSKHSLTKREFREVWKPTITIKQIASDPYVYRAIAEMDFYGRKETATEFGDTASGARRMAFNALHDRICGRG